MALEQKLPGISATGGERQTLVAGVALFAAHAEKLAAFYAKVLSVSFKLRKHDDGREHHIASLDGVQVEIKSLTTASGEPTSDAGPSAAGGVSRSELSFRVADVNGSMARAITSGGRVLQRAEQYDWGTFGVVIDPEGNRLGLYSPPKNSDESTTEGTA